MEECVLDAERSSIDFINYLCDAALNLDPSRIETEKTACELFTSSEFAELGNLVNTWKGINSVSGQKLVDFILNYE